MASRKVIIYQVFTRLYGNSCQTRKPFGTISENGCGKMNDFSPTVLKAFREAGITHVWYTGIVRHATMTNYTQFGIPSQHPAVVKGRAGSPYAITDYYDVDPDLAVNVAKRMEEFERLVNRTHRAGLKMIIDFVPNHVARQYKSIAKPKGVSDLGEEDNQEHGFDPQNNFYYCPGQSFAPCFDLCHGESSPYEERPAKATGNDCFHNAPSVSDWYETVKLNYGVDYYAGRVGHFDPIPDTWQKMLHILLFWAGKGVDGFRCDMAEMVPAEFWTWVTAQVKEAFPGILFVGEVYNPAEYRRYINSGFDWLYDKVGMYDTLIAVLRHHQPADAISRSWQQTDDIADHMLFFLENHDEQRLASPLMLGVGQRALPAVVVALLLRQNPFMLYAGQEWGEDGMEQAGFSGPDGRTTIFDYWALRPERHTPLTDSYRQLLHIARTEDAVANGQMFDLMYVNQHLQRQYAFLRATDRELLLVAVNFDDVPAEIHVVLPAHAFNHLGIKPRTAQATNLLTDAMLTFDLQPDQSVALQLPARGATILKFIPPRGEPLG